MEPLAVVQIDEVRAELEGLRANIELVDTNTRRWRDVTNNAFNLLTEREARDAKARETRQKALDRWLFWLAVGVSVALFLQVALLFIFVGYVIAS